MDHLDLAAAQQLDAADPLRAFADRFVPTEPGLVYLDGNSLGRLPISTRDRLRRFVDDEWAGDLIRGWDRWQDLPTQVGDRIGEHLLGARPGEVVVSDSTTVNLYKLVAAAIDGRPDRTAIVADADDFPTDRYVVEGLAAQRGRSVRWVEGDPIEGLAVDTVVNVLDETVAVVVLSHLHYRCGALADVAAITAAAHAVGALVVWDLSHSGGSVPVDLTGWDVDLAVGCTYKYLDGGPGAPAWLYVRREHHGVLRQPIWGWFGQRDLFQMARGYDPRDGVAAFLTGTPSVPALVAIDEGVALLAEAGIDRLRAKGMALTSFAVDLLDAHLDPLGFTLGSPRDPERRGSHVSLRHERALELCTALTANGVIPDFRTPDSIRLGLAPLTTSFVDVWTAVDRLATLASLTS